LKFTYIPSSTCFSKPVFQARRIYIALPCVQKHYWHWNHYHCMMLFVMHL